MTRIYTNVPSLIAQKNLTRSMSTLQTSLQRLSTGYKINSGKDDPAGLIASELLRSDITGIKMAIRNTERANMMIATADSALNEVARLLNDIRGLITEAANDGAMSAEMIAANQLQVDASLDAIDRISTQTSFMGLKLLDGSLDFETKGVNRDEIKGLSIHQVTFSPDKSPIDVNIEVRTAAEKAALYYNKPALAEALTLTFGGNLGYRTETFQKGATVQDIAKVVNASSNSTGVIAEVGNDAIAGTILTSSLGVDNDIIITAGTPGAYSGNIEIKYLPGTSEGIYVDYQEAISPDMPSILNVYLQMEEYKSATAPVIDVSPGIHDNNALSFTANIKGEQYNNASIQFVDGLMTQQVFGRVGSATQQGNPTGTANDPYAYYNDIATKSTALFGDVNGLGNIPSLASSGTYFAITANAAGIEYNDVAIQFMYDSTGTAVPAGLSSYARYDTIFNPTTGQTEKSLNIYFNTSATLADVEAALRREGTFSMSILGAADSTHQLLATDGYDAVMTPYVPGALPPKGYSNTQNSGGDAGTLFIVMDSQATALTANDLVDMFNLEHVASRGSERAASLFTVAKTADNDGTGPIYLYGSYTATIPDPADPTGTATITVTVPTKTAFYQALQNGVTGNHPITTGAQLVTALNNSAFWGMIMCPEMIAELAQYNSQGQYFDITNPPPITAKLSPNNKGLTAVSIFEEVAYYGNPIDGTALQFLGEKNSPNIRFVAEPGNDHLWIDRTTVPDTLDFAQAVLTATDAYGSLIITANKKGGDHDDVQINFKRINEDISKTTDPDRADGWVEYDPGVSFAEAMATFKEMGGAPITNAAFYVTSTERGDRYNNIPVMMTTNPLQNDPIEVTFDKTTNQIRISLLTGHLEDPTTLLPPGTYTQITANAVIAAINNANIGYTATLSFAEQHDNDGTGTFENLGLKNNQLFEIANTGTTGGHKGGTVTIWLADKDDAAGSPPDANDVIRLINTDPVVSQMFNARTYTSGPDAGTGLVDFVNNRFVVTSGGLVEKGAITVHLVTDKYGLVQTTARDLAEWWDKQDPAYVDNISASIVRPQGAIWDDCNDNYGMGILGPTVWLGECDEIIARDIQFVGWNDKIESQTYVPSYASGTMTSDNGIDASYLLTAKRLGPDYNGFTIVYANDPSVTGFFADNLVEGSQTNPCSYDKYTGLPVDNCGNAITSQYMTYKGVFLELDNRTKTITVHINEGKTTVNDIKQLIESDPITKNLFSVTPLGSGAIPVSMLDDTLVTTGGLLPPGELNGAKLLFGSDAADFFLIFKSAAYGSDQFVDVKGITTDGGATIFALQNANGEVIEKDWGGDVEALINGVKAAGRGLDVSMNTSTLSMNFTLSEGAATDTDFYESFSILGGGATFQVGPDVVTTQQITLGIGSVNSAQLGGSNGKLYQLRSGQNAELKTDTNLAFRIVQDAIVNITSIRGRLGTLQKATFEPNINVLNDTLEAIMAAESQIRDTDFAEETAALTRAQILVQSGLNTLGIANQLPNYMLSLLGR